MTEFRGAAIQNYIQEVFKPKHDRQQGAGKWKSQNIYIFF